MLELVPLSLPAFLLVASWAGWRVQRALSEHHRSRDTVEAVRLALGMLVTFAALVLGLLTSSAKSHFDAAEAALQSYGVDLISLDQRLREFGTPADAARTLLRAYTAAAVADTWPEETAPAGDYPRNTAHASDSAESVELGEMLLRVDRAVGRLPADGPLQRDMLRTLQGYSNATLQQRWMVVEAAQPSTSWPFMLVMSLWLVLVFAIFGLSSPANPVVYTTIGLTALSVTAALWLIMELETPLTGILKVDSTPLRDAVAHMDRPPAAPQP